MNTNAYEHLGPGDKGFAALSAVAYRAFRKAGLSVDDAKSEAESFAYGAAELLDNRVQENA